jgi:ribonucleases P/MRP protein subunit RPP40
LRADGATQLVIASNSKCELYADDSKLLRDVSCVDGVRGLQADLDRVVNWSRLWLVRLNDHKCHVMHLGKNNNHHDYWMETSGGRTKLNVTNSEKDLGVIVSDDLKWEAQCSRVASKGNRMLGILRRSFASRDTDLWKKLYITYVRPLLEFAVPVWSPYLEGDIATIEKVQRRATRIPFERFASIPSYTERCKLMGLQQLEKRRIRGDVIQWFKLERNAEKVVWASPVSRVDGRCGRRTQMRGETVKNCDQRWNFFINRIVNIWNDLPDKVVEAQSVNSLKGKLDKIYIGKI